MPRSRHLILETDGAARGNPGLAGAGVIIKDEHGSRVESFGRFLGVATNNQAEYRALIEGLTAVRRHNPSAVTVCMDSELVVRQMNGEYRVRHPDLIPLYSQATQLAAELPNITFVHVSREQNPGADEVANLAIDGRMVRGRGAGHD